MLKDHDKHKYTDEWEILTGSTVNIQTYYAEQAITDDMKLLEKQVTSGLIQKPIGNDIRNFDGTCNCDNRVTSGPDFFSDDFIVEVCEVSSNIKGRGKKHPRSITRECERTVEKQLHNFVGPREYDSEADMFFKKACVDVKREDTVDKLIQHTRVVLEAHNKVDEYTFNIDEYCKQRGLIHNQNRKSILIISIDSLIAIDNKSIDVLMVKEFAEALNEYCHNFDYIIIHYPLPYDKSIALSRMDVVNMIQRNSFYTEEMISSYTVYKQSIELYECSKE